MKAPSWFKQKESPETGEPGYRTIQVPQMLYRYRALNDYTIESLKEKSLYFAGVAQLNDVLDGRFYVPRRKLDNSEEQRLKDAKENGHLFAQNIAKLEDGTYGYNVSDNPFKEPSDITNSLFSSIKAEVEGPEIDAGICCFSEVPDSLPMWAHYGDNHRGICIAYETTPELFTEVTEGKLHLTPVEYKDKLIAFDLMTLIQLDPKLVLENVARYKSTEWAYEKEWRLIIDGGGIIRNNPLKVHSIIFGNRADSSHIGKVISALGDKAGVSYGICFANQDSYGFRIEPLEMAFGPIMHDRSIFKDVHEWMADFEKKKSKKKGVFRRLVPFL